MGNENPTLATELPSPEELARWRADALTERTVWGRSLEQERIRVLIDSIPNVERLIDHYESRLTLVHGDSMAVDRIKALADDMDERGKPGDSDSETDVIARRQIREDVKRLRAALGDRNSWDGGGNE